MRAIRNSVTAVALGLMLMPGLAAASDIEADIAAMKAQLASMEERLDATNDQLAEAEATVEDQQVRIEESGLEEERGSFSAISSFVEQTDIDAWLTASYNINFRGGSAGGSGTGVGGNGAGYFNNTVGHVNSNTFQFDQAGINITKAPTDESRGGYQLEFLWGAAGSAIPGGVFLANVSYLAPVLEGLQIDGGIIPTRLGVEVAEINGNWNQTRGITWNMQPVNHTGAIGDLSITEEINVAFGVVNEVFATNSGALFDANDNKVIMGQAAYTADKFSVLGSVLYGVDSTGADTSDFFGANGGGATNATDRMGIFDAIVYLDPVENLSLYLNYDFRWETVTGGTGTNGSGNTHGVAAAAKLQIIDEVSAAVRGEYVTSSVAGTQVWDGWTITATFDHKTTENLTTRLEFRGDGATGGAGAAAGLVGAGLLPGGNKEAGMFLISAMYQF